MIYGLESNAVIVGEPERKGLQSNLPPCECGGPVCFSQGCFRCAWCGLPTVEKSQAVTTGPLGSGIEVSRGPDDSQRLPDSGGNQKRDSKRPGK